MQNKKPIHFLIFKIVGILAIAVAIFGIVLSIKGFCDFESNNFMIGGFMATFGGFAGIACLIMGFRPEIAKMSTSSAKYIQQENKEALTDIANTTAEIAEGAVVKTAKAVKEGLSEEEKMFCKHCGAQIDADSTFCNKCGQKQ